MTKCISSLSSMPCFGIVAAWMAGKGLRRQVPPLLVHPEHDAQPLDCDLSVLGEVGTVNMCVFQMLLNNIAL